MHLIRTASAAALVLLLAGCGGQPRPAQTTSAASSDAVPRPTTVTFATPSGFHRTDAYTISVPLTPHRDSQWRVPDGEPAGLDVIFVNSYVLRADSDDWSDARKRRQLRDWADAVHARHASAPTRTTVDDRPGYRQRIEQPDGGGVLRYDATFVFTGRSVVQVGCQWDRHRALMRTACRRVLATLTIGAA